MRKLTSAAFLVLIPLALSAAQLTLRNGTVIYGQFVSGDSRTIVFDDENGARRRYPTNQVQVIDLQAPGTSGANRDSRYNDNGAGWRSADRTDGSNYSEWVTVPAGTEVSVRTDEGIYSSNTGSGTTYPASIVNDVVDPAGVMVIPRGSPARLIMKSDGRGGYFLDLDSVDVRGHHYRVDTSDVNVSQGIGANRRTATYVGGGAVLGTLIGAIAGGGKGAAIGAIAGAAAGGGAQVLTRGHEVRAPAETVLNFRLEQPLALREMR